jgi:hypothetical protein
LPQLEEPPEAGAELGVAVELEAAVPEEDPLESLLVELEESVEEDGVVEEDAPRLSFL